MDKLKTLMKDSGLEDHNLTQKLKKIQGECNVCKKYRKKESKPKTSVPKARNVNEVVSIDLKPVSNLIYIKTTRETFCTWMSFQG